MKIRLAFCTHLFFSQYLNPVGYGFVFFWLLCTSCHKEDTGAYMVTSEDFYEVAVPEHNYHRTAPIFWLKNYLNDVLAIRFLLLTSPVRPFKLGFIDWDYLFYIDRSI